MVTLLLTLLACKEAPSDSSPPLQCPASPAPAALSVRDARGGPLYYPRAYVRDEAGVETPCADVAEGQWSCADGLTGALTVVVSYPGFDSVETPLPLDDDGCRTGGEALEIVLPYAGAHYDARRTFFVQLIEDPYECEHAWELYGMNCYQTMELCPSGYAEIILTDIVNGASYDGGEDQITLTLLPGAEARGEVLLTRQPDDTWLDDWINASWREDTAGLFPYTICE